MNITSKLLADLLTNSAQSENGITHIIGEKKEKHITYKELRQRAYTLLGVLQVKNLSPGKEMIILVNKNEHFIDVFWACILGGIVPVPLSSGISDNHSEKILSVYQKLKNPTIYSSRDELGRFTNFLKKKRTYKNC